MGLSPHHSHPGAPEAPMPGPRLEVLTPPGQGGARHLRFSQVSGVPCAARWTPATQTLIQLLYVQEHDIQRLKVLTKT